MKITFFSAKPYDKESFNNQNKPFGFELEYYETHLGPHIINAVEKTDAICVFVNDSVNAQVIEALAKKGVRVIALRCAGFNNVDLQAAKANGIEVCRVPAYSPEAVAEHAVAMLLTLNRKTHKAYNRVREQNFSLNGLLGFDVHHKTVGVVGTGNIGKAFCKIMLGFGCKVIAHDVATNQQLETMGVKFVSLPEILKQSDIISLHCPLNDETHHIINSNSISWMKKGVMIINTSRGGLIDTKAVIDALKLKQIGYLGIDVYEQEEKLFFRDLSANIIEDDTIQRLMSFPNVLVTAHQAFFTAEALQQIADATLNNINDLIAGNKLANTAAPIGLNSGTLKVSQNLLIWETANAEAMTYQFISKNRIQSIDVLRGLVMVIMALDHVRDFFYKADLGKAADAALNPTNLETTYPMLFFTRWITHFCAPLFVFLAGTSIYMMCLRKPKKELSSFLIKRGVWLVILEVTVMTFGWTFNPFFNVFILQVIWAIGVSMILLGLLIHLPYKIIFAVGLFIVLGHNMMDFPSLSSALKGGLVANLLYSSNFSIYAITQNHGFIIVYSFLPWTGVMLLGFCFGKLFEPGSTNRIKTLFQLGSAVVILFFTLRFVNVYGDPVPWSVQPRGFAYTLLSFFNVNKYPPSLLFLSMTLGPGILFLAFIEKIQNKFTAVMNVYGKVPMIFYVLHFYIIHLLVVIVFYLQGFGSADIVPPNNPFLFKANGLGFGLWGVYGIWAMVVLFLFPVCRKYGLYKSSHHQWWLSYL